MPSPNAFSEKNGFEVKLAGRGFRFEGSSLDEYTGKLNPSSCYTNEGTMKTNKNLRKRNFLPCKSPQTQMKRTKIESTPKDIEYCSDFLQREHVDSFSIHDDLEFSANTWKFKNVKAGGCEYYYRKAKQAWVNHMTSSLLPTVSVKNLRIEFDEKVERIQIWNKNHESTLEEAIETCYNVHALGRYGICQIDENYSPFGFQWGFCSRSCSVQNADIYGLFKPKEPYEEAIFEYLDTAPSFTLFASKY